MVDPKIIHKQLRDINFGGSAWNQSELRELPKIIHDDESISECVNGWYEGGVALLVATNQRLLLIDKKMLRFLNIEDLRFDMINEIDYSRRLMGASILISTGSKVLKFSSTNQKRLRHLINLVQQHMGSGKRSQAQSAETQQQHLEEINRQLQIYLMAQQQYLQQQAAGQVVAAEAPKPDAQLSDYLFAQRLLEQNRGVMPQSPVAQHPQLPPQQSAPVAAPTPIEQQQTVHDLAAAARQEIFGKMVGAAHPMADSKPSGTGIDPMRIAYSKLPMMLRNRKFGRPSLHAHTQEQVMPTGRSTAPSAG